MNNILEKVKQYFSSNFGKLDGIISILSFVITLVMSVLYKNRIDISLLKALLSAIITFAIFADDEDKFIFDGEINLGEFIIALDKVEEESKKKNKSFEEELYFLISHGIMHLLGFDHQTEEDYNFVVDMQNEALKVVEYDKI